MSSSHRLGDLGAAIDDEGPYIENPYASANTYWLTWESPGTPAGYSVEKIIEGTTIEFQQLRA